ncbi:hypothetical protein B0T19DRAFT_409375 [Cercophora scortea]|uniref:Uncharacterized protein n=1 Tax=Cercophora scortea TaxID=314031 RepID=A0AAE0MLD6_9PEZI|nr:hypothetical protein B0T19DRAFT_409375 [Cercophora scortea]
MRIDQLLVGLIVIGLVSFYALHLFSPNGKSRIQGSFPASRRRRRCKTRGFSAFFWCTFIVFLVGCLALAAEGRRHRTSCVISRNRQDTVAGDVQIMKVQCRIRWSLGMLQHL